MLTSLLGGCTSSTDGSIDDTDVVIDLDEDGVEAMADCDDQDAHTYPGAATKESDTTACMTDADGDGYGDLSPAEGVSPGTDCDDEDPTTSPAAGASEYDPTRCMTDADQDGYGSSSPADGVTGGTDCDDDDALISPGAEETAYDTIDNDCDWRSPDADGDGDGYSDDDETHAGTDPNDASSVIYTGGWPYHQDKDSIVDPGWDSEAHTGMVMPRFIATDQFGELVDLYDYAYQGVPVAVDLSTHWCTPCQRIAGWMAGLEDSSLLEDYPWWDPAYERIPQLVWNGDILWITIIYEDVDHNDAVPQDAIDWDEAFPHPYVPVLADTEKEMHGWIRPTGIPCVNLLNEDMTLMDYQNRGLDAAFDMLLDLYGDE